MSESTVDLETATSAPQEILNELRNSRFNHQRAQELMRQCYLRAQQMIEQGLTDDAPEAAEWRNIQRLLLDMGVHPSWLEPDSIFKRIRNSQTTEKQFGTAETQRRTNAFYHSIDLQQPFPVELSATPSTYEQSALDLRLAQHFRRGNERLRQQGFIPERHLTRHLVFDEAALAGLSEMISSTLEEFHRRGQVEEDMLVLVGERQYLDGILYSVVYGSLNPSGLIAERRTGGVRFDWQKMIDEIETTREVDTKDIPLSSYEAVGILHTHPPERTGQGRVVAARRLSLEDEAVLRSFDSQAPGLILGAVVPGVSEHEGTNQILQHTAFWNRSASYAQQITSLKVLGPPH